MSERGFVVVSTIVVSTFLLISVQAQARSVKVTSVLGRPYLFEEETLDANGNAVIGYSGFIKDILDTLNTRMPEVRFELSVRNDSRFGSEQSGRWNGMIGEVVRQEAAMAVGPITVTAYRDRVVDFGIPFQTVGRAIVMKKNPPNEPKGRALDVRLGKLFSPLEDSVWLLSGMAWFVASLVLYLICRINPYEWRRMVKDQEATMREGESFTCVNTYWFMMGAIFWQGFMRSPRSMGGRIVVAFWWLYAFIFVSMYIASLTNFLRQDLSPPVTNNYGKIQTIDDIANDNRITVGAIRHGATAAFYKTSRVTANQKLWARMSGDDSFEETLEEGIDKVRESTPSKPYAFIAESTMAEYFATQKPCDLYMVRDLPTTGFYAFAYPMSTDKSNSTLRRFVDSIILMLQESGHMRALEKKWFSGKCSGLYVEDTSSSDTNNAHIPPFQKVDLAAFSGALILLVIGLLFGSVVTLCEFGLYKYSGEEKSYRVEEKRHKKDAMLSDREMQDGHRGGAQPMTVV